LTIYGQVPATFNPPELEKKILELWKREKAFETLVQLNAGKTPWSFMDGPITANNPMGVHHGWGRTYKDLYQRFWAARGRDLRYQNGFDCQGLWVEVEVEKELGFKSKRDIEGYGIADFIKKCKQRVLNYAAVQTEQSIRLGYWMHWDDTATLRRLATLLDQPRETVTVVGTKGTVTDSVEQLVGRLGRPEIGGSYFTFSNENNYMIWTLLRRCHERGWIYKGRDVMPWCPRCSTALSQHEIVTEGYREVVHLSIFVKFPLRERKGESLLVWTTTPWTLTSNVAAAVHPELTYVKVCSGGEVLWLAESALERAFSNKKKVLILETLTGSEMEGWTFSGPFDELPAEQSLGAAVAHRVILWKEVSQTEGTGIVHIAPGCGKEDFDLSKEHGLPVVAPLDDYGVFVEGFGWLSNMHVYNTAEPIVENLRGKGLLFKTEDYVHRYPVCWRCASELVFRVVDEWFISMGKNLGKPPEEVTEEEKEANLRYQIMEVTKQIRWIPSFGQQQELDWLLNMKDWMISKKRYWGLALPIWECQKCGSFDVIGSEEELKTRAVKGWEQFEGHTPHRPWIDYVKIRCPRCGAEASRIPEVGNPWLDAGIVAYSTLDYQHNRTYWEKWFPADLISESFPGQFRNWFYSLLTMSAIMERRSPTKNCFSYGLVLDETGREMHKSWGNAIWFDDAAENMGADVMRWMYCRTRPEGNVLFGYKKADEVKKQFFLPLWNIYSFFVTYANLDMWTPSQKTSNIGLSQLDRWILSRLQRLVASMTDSLENYDAAEATASAEEFIQELSTWYIRRSRRRFWKSRADEDKNSGYMTLYNCITTLIKLLGPFTPFITEEMYQNLVLSAKPDAPRSVHHAEWPKVDPALMDERLMEDMDTVIRVASLGRAIRSTSGIKLRQPLPEVMVVAPKQELDRLEGFTDLIKDELNVRKVTLTTQEKELTRHEVSLIPSRLGKKYGALYPKLREAISKMDAEDIVRSLHEEKKAVDIKIGNTTVTLTHEDVEIKDVPIEGYSLAEEKGIIVGLSLTVTKELALEGLAKDIVRRIQNQRKEAGFNIADEIETYYETGSRLREVFAAYGEYIASETLSKVLENRTPPSKAFVQVYDLEGENLCIGLIPLKNSQVR
jgi:isoleucyl-tRNA synthetase